MSTRSAWLPCMVLALLPAAAGAWSPPTLELAQQAKAEYSGRLVIVDTLDHPDSRDLPVDAQMQLRDAEQTLFHKVGLKGVITPFRRHWFDAVRCAIYVPAGADQPEAEFWTMAHEIGHCVARLGGWQESLWRDPDVVVRHRVESWADAFAARMVPASARQRVAEMAIQRRANLGDAAYMTDKAIRCSLAFSQTPAESLREVGLQVEQLLQASCLMDSARLRATDGFLSSIK